MSVENKVVSLEVVVNGKMELAEKLKKEMEESARVRFNNLLRHVVEDQRRIDKLEEMVSSLVDYILEK